MIKEYINVTKSNLCYAMPGSAQYEDRETVELQIVKKKEEQ